MGPQTNDQEAAILAATDAWFEAYSQRDMSRVMATFTSGEAILLFGTGVDERRVGLSEIRLQLERDWAQSDAAWVERGATTTRVMGDAAVVAFDCRFRFRASGQEGEAPGRGTFVFERQGAGWLVAHMHVSIPYAEQPVGRSFWS